jgi:hypothetical protein
MKMCTSLNVEYKKFSIKILTVVVYCFLLTVVVYCFLLTVVVYCFLLTVVVYCFLLTVVVNCCCVLFSFDSCCVLFSFDSCCVLFTALLINLLEISMQDVLYKCFECCVLFSALLINLLEILGTHSITAIELKQLIGHLKLDDEENQVQSITVILNLIGLAENVFL